MHQNHPADGRSSAIVANGQIDNLMTLSPLIQASSRLVAVDRGLVYCKNLGLTPHLIVGDFDSVPRELLDEYESVPKITLPREKDETDLEVALEYELQGSQIATLFGAWGGRIDHSVTNLLITSRYPGRVYIKTELETVFAIDREAEIAVSIGQTLSLLPLNGPVTGITTRGLQWELRDGTLDATFVGISNICLHEKIHISVRHGILLCSLLNESG